VPLADDDLGAGVEPVVRQLLEHEARQQVLRHPRLLRETLDGAERDPVRAHEFQILGGF